MKVKELKPADYNPRVISDGRLAMLGKSMKAFGDLSGVVFNVETDNLVTSHQRLKHLDPAWKIVKERCVDTTGTVAFGYIETPFGRFSYREVKWPIEKEMRANIAANNHGGEFDKDRLASLFKKLGNKSDEAMGFKKGEFEKLFAEQGKQKKVIYRDTFEVVITCADEADTEKVYLEIKEKGYKCRPLIF